MNPLPKRPFGYVLLVVILLGIFLRWVNLDSKVYWVDEVHTSTRIAGYTRSDVQAQIFDHGFLPVEALYQYQVPQSNQPFSATWQALTQHPEHPPLYFVLGWIGLKGWLPLSGDWVLGLRSLAVMISLAVLPGVYWLCRELFRRPETGWMAIALFAISPLHILYAQEARQYSLFALVTVLSGAALLRAVRRDRPLDWMGYTVTLIIGFYSHLLFGLVAIAHGLYMLLRRLPWNQVRPFALSLGASLLAFVPWIVVLVRYLAQIERAIEATQRGFNLDYLINGWLRNLSRVFFSTDLGIANLLLVALVAYALYHLCRHTPRPTWVFILMLILVSALPLMVADIFTGGITSTRIRYLIPSYIGIQLAIAPLLTHALIPSSSSLFPPLSSPLPPPSSLQTLKRVLFILMMTAMVITSVLDAHKIVTWTKSDKGAYYPAIAAAINQSPDPVVISDSSPTYVLALGRSLREGVTLHLVTRPNSLVHVRNELTAFSDIFVFDPSLRLQNVLHERLNYSVIPVVKQNDAFGLLKAE